jgi:hypothetical protein
MDYIYPIRNNLAKRFAQENSTKNGKEPRLLGEHIPSPKVIIHPLKHFPAGVSDLWGCIFSFSPKVVIR